MNHVILLLAKLLAGISSCGKRYDFSSGQNPPYVTFHSTAWFVGCVGDLLVMNPICKRP